MVRGKARGHAAARFQAHGLRILVVQIGKQRGEVADVLLEQVEDRGDPALTEEDTGADPLVLQLDGTGVGGLGEQLDTGLGMQSLAEEEGAVGRQRDLRGADGLGSIPMLSERGRLNL